MVTSYIALAHSQVAHVRPNLGDYSGYGIDWVQENETTGQTFSFHSTIMRYFLIRLYYLASYFNLFTTVRTYSHDVGQEDSTSSVGHCQRKSQWSL
jgi:hypothetical protein